MKYWFLKIIAKIILSRLPLSHAVWTKIGVFKNGKMNERQYSKKIFELHFRNFSQLSSAKDFHILELGPGDGILTGILAYLYGAKKTYLVDVSQFAIQDADYYKNIYLELAEEIQSDRSSPNFDNFEKMLASMNVSYLTNGLESLRTIDSNSVDFIFSHSVLEHVRYSILSDTFDELFRLSAKNAILSHNIDYQDHLSKAQNNLRFSNRIWESDFMSSSGFYTNRVQAQQMHALATNAGFKIIDEGFGKWLIPVLPKSSVHSDLRKGYDPELTVPTSRFTAVKLSS